MRSHLEESHRCLCQAKMFLKVQMFDIKKQPRYNNVYTFQAPAEIPTRYSLFLSFSFFSLVLVIERDQSTTCSNPQAQARWVGRIAIRRNQGCANDRSSQSCKKEKRRQWKKT